MVEHPSMPAALDVTHLSVSFGDIRILDDLSFRVEAGTTLAVANGSTKVNVRSWLAGASFFTKRRTASGVFGIVPSARTAPLGSATATAIVSACTSAPQIGYAFP
jgi:hypothetical protein